jgi:hypothetical protein
LSKPTIPCRSSTPQLEPPNWRPNGCRARGTGLVLILVGDRGTQRRLAGALPPHARDTNRGRHGRRRRHGRCPGRPVAVTDGQGSGSCRHRARREPNTEHLFLENVHRGEYRGGIARRPLCGSH